MLPASRKNIALRYAFVSEVESFLSPSALLFQSIKIDLKRNLKERKIFSTFFNFLKYTSITIQHNQAYANNKGGTFDALKIGFLSISPILHVLNFFVRDEKSYLQYKRDTEMIKHLLRSNPLKLKTSLMRCVSQTKTSGGFSFFLLGLR